jgi:hypothetical protein
MSNISDSWPAIFQLQDSGYNIMKQRLGNKETTAETGWTLIKKTKKGILETGILLSALSTSISTDLFVTNLKDSTPIAPKGFSNQGNYHTVSAVAYAQKTLLLLKQVFSIKAEYGFATAYILEDSNFHFNHLLYRLNINTRHKFSKYVNGKLNASFSQHQLEPYKLNSIFLPYSINSFHNNLNVTLPLKTLNVSYGFSYSWKPAIVFTLYTARGTSFTGYSLMNSLDHFVQISSDSLTRRPLNNYYFSLNTNIYSFKHNLHFSSDIGYSAIQRFIQRRNDLLKNNSSIFFINTTLTKNWRKIYFIDLNASYTNIGFNLPSTLQTQVKQNVSDIKASISQRIAINKHSSVVLATDFFDKNIFTPHHLSFLMADAEYNFTIPKSPLSFTIRLQNITNQTKYSYVDNSALIQNFFSFPLIKRNIFLSLRYEL